MDPWQKMEQKYGNELKRGLLFSSLTTLQIGGPIKYFFEATSQNELIKLLRFVKDNDLKFLVIGGGSNLLVSDDGFDGLVIKNSITGIKQEGTKLIAQAGTELKDLVQFTVNHNLAGLYKLVGIPGTVGGAVYGKIAAYGDDISDYLESVTCFNGQEIISLSKNECEFSYRDSGFKRNKFTILSITFKNLPTKDKDEMLQEQEKIMAKRLLLYPPEVKCPGSLFKNIRIQDLEGNLMPILRKELKPEILERVENNIRLYEKIPVGALLEHLGALGDRLGQVKITDNHANTFTNTGGATAKEFYDLAKKYSNKAKEKFGITLEPEVQLVNLPALN